MKFSFSDREFNNWKGKMAERLVEIYIQQILVPSFKREGFSKVFTINPEKHFFPFPLSEPTIMLLRGEKVPDRIWDSYARNCEIMVGDDETKLEGKAKIRHIRREKTEEAEMFPSKVKRVFESQRVFPTRNLLERTISLLCLLDVCTDGVLFKIKAYKGMPVVDGELEIIEVKLGKATFSDNQIENYAEVVAAGTPLRFFHVDTISFDKNQFEIEEKLITNVEELKTVK